MRCAPSGRVAPVLSLLLCAVAAQAASDRPVPGGAHELLKGQPPAPGHYDATMCVAVAAAPPSCGPVLADVGPAGQTLVRVSDIAYRLESYGDQLGVSLFHGTMQIDGFFAPYRWSGPQLEFRDLEKGTRYELKLGPRRFDTP
jgi:hypothetical protein